MFQKATKKQLKLKMALTGPSGNGKTFSALTLAFGIGKKVAVIDTERGSSSLYENLFPPYDVCNLNSPFTTEKYMYAIEEAVKQGYDVLIIDSGTHAWAGTGGILSRKNEKDLGGGNSYVNWGEFTEEQNVFMERILSADVHLIFTMRSKQDYVLQQNEKGKMVPVKVGMAPVQREGTEYEFDVVFDLEKDHSFSVSKDRTHLFDKRSNEVITESHGKELLSWLLTGTPSNETTIAMKTAASIPIENRVAAKEVLKEMHKNIPPSAGHGTIDANSDVGFKLEDFAFKPMEGSYYPLNVLEVMPLEVLKTNFMQLTDVFKTLCEKANKVETCTKVLEAVGIQKTRFEKIWMLEAYIFKIETYLKENGNVKP